MYIDIQHALCRSSQELSGLRMPRLHPQQQGKTSRRCRGVQVHAAKDVDFADRAVGALPYLVPLFDGIKYGEMLHMPLRIRLHAYELRHSFCLEHYLCQSVK